MCRKKAILCSTFLCVLSAVWAENPCSIEGISDPDRVYTNPEFVNDSYIGVVQIFKNTNIKEAFIDDSKYISVSVKDNILEISTTPEFESYEEKEEASTIIVNINLVCEDESDTLEYRLQVQDENNHDPQFERDHYYYTFYTSLPYLLDFALTDLQPIVANDVDLSNYKVDFAIEENDYFAINYATRSPKSAKNYLAILFNVEEINAPFNETFEITVTDSGNPNRSSTALVTVEVLELIRPIFTKTLYTAHLTEDLKVLVDNGPIAFVDDIENVTVILPSEFSEYFRAEVNQDDEVEITVISSDVLNLVNENDVIALTLKSTTSYITDETAIVIYTIEFASPEEEEEEEEEESNGEEADGENIENTTAVIFTTETNEEVDPDFSSTIDDIGSSVNNEDNNTTTNIEVASTTEIAEENISTTAEDSNTNITDDDESNETIKGDVSTTEISEDVSTDSENEEITDSEFTTVINERPSTQSIYVELTGFKHWVSVSQGFNMFIFALVGITIAGAILCIKFKLYK